jgi:enoyl-CoA hydratase
MLDRQTKTLQYTTEGNVATIQLTQEYSTMNMIKELTLVCNHLEDENPCQVVVFKGSSTCFSRGLHFGEFHNSKSLDIHGFNKWEKICTRIERLPKVTICVLQGDVIGAGFQLALVSDVRIATKNLNMQLPEVKLGFLPGMAVFRLSKYIGLGQAKRLILRCETLDAQRALDLGLVDSLCDNIEEEIQNCIADFSPIHPRTVQLARRLINESFHDSNEDATGHFLAAQHLAISQGAFMDSVRKMNKSEK